METQKRYPTPPWDMDTAAHKLLAEEDAWNAHDAEKVAQGYTNDAEIRDELEFLNGREEFRQYLTKKWKNQLDYKLKLDLWGALKGRMAVRFEAEWHNAGGQWYRSYGVQVFQFNDDGYVQKRFASANDISIAETDRKL